MKKNGNTITFETPEDCDPMALDEITGSPDDLVAIIESSAMRLKEMREASIDEGADPALLLSVADLIIEGVTIWVEQTHRMLGLLPPREKRQAVLADTLRELREVEADLRRWVETPHFDGQIEAEMGLRLGTVELANRAVEREGLE